MGKTCAYKMLCFLRHHPNTQWSKTILFIFTNTKFECQKYAELYNDFKSVEIIEKNAPEKVICQNLLQVRSIEKDKLQFWTLFLL